MMQARRTQLLLLLLAAVLCCSAVPALQQDEGSSSESKSSKDAATEAPFASGAKSEAADEGTPAPADAPSKTTQPAAPAPAPKAAATASKPSKKSKIVEIAPEAEVQNEVDDIDVAEGTTSILSGSLRPWQLWLQAGHMTSGYLQCCKHCSCMAT
jgi:hypothetical protein